MTRNVSTLQLPNAPNEPPCVRSLPSERTVQRRKERMPPYCQIILTKMFADMSSITDRLFLTGVGGMTKENFARNRINFVINATLEAPNLCMNGVKTLRVPVDDTPEDDIQTYFNPVADQIARHVESKKGNIVVHCVAGVSRSTSLVLAYLMKYKGMTLHQAYNHVHDQRAVVRPNNGFFRQLIEFEKGIHGRASVEVVEVNFEGVRIQVPDFFLQEHEGFVKLEAMKEKAKQDKNKQITGAEPPTICQAVGGTNEEAAAKMDATLKQNVLEQYVLSQGAKTTTNQQQATADKPVEEKGKGRRRAKDRLKSKEIKTDVGEKEIGSVEDKTVGEAKEIKQTGKKHKTKTKMRSKEVKEVKEEMKEEIREVGGKETAKPEVIDQVGKRRRKGMPENAKKEELLKETVPVKEEEKPERSKKIVKPPRTKRKKAEETPSPEMTITVEIATKPEVEKTPDVVKEESSKKVTSDEGEARSKKEYKRKRKRSGGGTSPPAEPDMNKKENSS